MNHNKILWSIGALCCLSLILFLIVSSIILALIPLYLPFHDLKIQTNFNKSELVYVEYLGTANNGITGSVNNIDEIEKQYKEQFGFSHDQMNVTKIQIVHDTTVEQNRRRRVQSNQYDSSQKKRALDNYRILFTCSIRYSDLCQLTSCRTKFLSTIRNTIGQKTHLSFRFSFVSITDSNIQYDLTYVGFTSFIPTQFLNIIEDDTSTTTSQTIEHTITTTHTAHLGNSTNSIISTTNSSNVDVCDDSVDCDDCDDSGNPVECDVCDDSGIPVECDTCDDSVDCDDCDDSGNPVECDVCDGSEDSIDSDGCNESKMMS